MADHRARRGRDDAAEAEVRDLAKRLYERVDWRWMQPRPPRVAMAWLPETGFGEADWHGYDESMVLYLLALGSPTYPIPTTCWNIGPRSLAGSL